MPRFGYRIDRTAAVIISGGTDTLPDGRMGILGGKFVDYIAGSADPRTAGIAPDFDRVAGILYGDTANGEVGTVVQAGQHPVVVKAAMPSGAVFGADPAGTGKGVEIPQGVNMGAFCRLLEPSSADGDLVVATIHNYPSSDGTQGGGG